MEKPRIIPSRDTPILFHTGQSCVHYTTLVPTSEIIDSEQLVCIDESSLPADAHNIPRATVVGVSGSPVFSLSPDNTCYAVIQAASSSNIAPIRMSAANLDNEGRRAIDPVVCNKRVIRGNGSRSLLRPRSTPIICPILVQQTTHKLNKILPVPTVLTTRQIPALRVSGIPRSRKSATLDRYNTSCVSEQPKCNRPRLSSSVSTPVSNITVSRSNSETISVHTNEGDHCYHLHTSEEDPDTTRHSIPYDDRKILPASDVSLVPTLPLSITTEDETPYHTNPIYPRCLIPVDSQTTKCVPVYPRLLSVIEFPCNSPPHPFKTTPSGFRISPGKFSEDTLLSGFHESGCSSECSNFSSSSNTRGQRILRHRLPKRKTKRVSYRKCQLYHCKQPALPVVDICRLHFRLTPHSNTCRCTFKDTINRRHCTNICYRLNHYASKLCELHKLSPLIPVTNEKEYIGMSPLEIADDLFEMVESAYSYNPRIRGLRNQIYTGDNIKIRIVADFPELQEHQINCDDVVEHYKNWACWRERDESTPIVKAQIKAKSKDFKYYTGLQVLRKIRSKLVKLQRLYLKRYPFIERRMFSTYSMCARSHNYQNYLYGSMHKYKRSLKHAAQYEDYKTLMNCHSYMGQSGLMRMKKYLSDQRRAGNRIKTFRTCNHPGCVSRRIPLAHFCMQHMLEEENQQLFIKCDVEDCDTIILPPSEYCLIHTVYEPKHHPLLCINPEGKVYLDKDIKNSEFYESIYPKSQQLLLTSETDDKDIDEESDEEISGEECGEMLSRKIKEEYSKDIEVISGEESDEEINEEISERDEKCKEKYDKELSISTEDDDNIISEGKTDEEKIEEIDNEINSEGNEFSEEDEFEAMIYREDEEYDNEDEDVEIISDDEGNEVTSGIEEEIEHEDWKLLSGESDDEDSKVISKEKKQTNDEEQSIDKVCQVITGEEYEFDKYNKVITRKEEKDFANVDEKILFRTIEKQVYEKVISKEEEFVSDMKKIGKKLMRVEKIDELILVEKEDLKEVISIEEESGVEVNSKVKVNNKENFNYIVEDQLNSDVEDSDVEIIEVEMEEPYIIDVDEYEE